MYLLRFKNYLHTYIIKIVLPLIKKYENFLYVKFYNMCL